jgi:hypothetical protein
MLELVILSIRWEHMKGGVTLNSNRKVRKHGEEDRVKVMK